MGGIAEGQGKAKWTQEQFRTATQKIIAWLQVAKFEFGTPSEWYKLDEEQRENVVKNIKTSKDKSFEEWRTHPPTTEQGSHVPVLEDMPPDTFEDDELVTFPESAFPGSLLQSDRVEPSPSCWPFAVVGSPRCSTKWAVIMVIVYMMLCLLLAALWKWRCDLAKELRHLGLREAEHMLNCTRHT